jgi:sugar-specific transcriptional regulator TrmB
MAVNLLQEIGLNKYEAEAYYALLTHGPLTGYELGKRSQVPSSRCYDVLERLCQRGLALVQPGEPARYQALEPALFLDQVRAGMEEALEALSNSLSYAKQTESTSEFWVVRGRHHILARAQALCAAAGEMLQLAIPESSRADFAVSLAQASRRGCSISLIVEPSPAVPTISLLTDGREALLGTLTTEGQAILSRNPALLSLLASFFRQMRPAAVTSLDEQPPARSQEGDWLEWEKRKQQRLRKNHADRHIA